MEEDQRLLKLWEEPRYKALRDMPGYSSGQIVGLVGMDYPDLFRRVGWWEFRKERDLPKYIKFLEENYVVVPIKHVRSEDHTGYWYFRILPCKLYPKGKEESMSSWAYSFFNYATEEEYKSEENQEKIKNYKRQG